MFFILFFSYQFFSFYLILILSFIISHNFSFFIILFHSFLFSFILFILLHYFLFSSIQFHSFSSFSVFFIFFQSHNLLFLYLYRLNTKKVITAVTMGHETRTYIRPQSSNTHMTLLFYYLKLIILSLSLCLLS